MNITPNTIYNIDIMEKNKCAQCGKVIDISKDAYIMARDGLFCCNACADKYYNR